MTSSIRSAAEALRLDTPTADLAEVPRVAGQLFAGNDEKHDAELVDFVTAAVDGSKLVHGVGPWTKLRASTRNWCFRMPSALVRRSLRLGDEQLSMSAGDVKNLASAAFLLFPTVDGRPATSTASLRFESVLGRVAPEFRTTVLNAYVDVSRGHKGLGYDPWCDFSRQGAAMPGAPASARLKPSIATTASGGTASGGTASDSGAAAAAKAAPQDAMRTANQSSVLITRHTPQTLARWAHGSCIREEAGESEAAWLPLARGVLVLRGVTRDVRDGPRARPTDAEYPPSSGCVTSAPSLPRTVARDMAGMLCPGLHFSDMLGDRAKERAGDRPTAPTAPRTSAVSTSGAASSELPLPSTSSVSEPALPAAPSVAPPWMVQARAGAARQVARLARRMCCCTASSGVQIGAVGDSQGVAQRGKEAGSEPTRLPVHVVVHHMVVHGTMGLDCRGQPLSQGASHDSDEVDPWGDSGAWEDSEACQCCSLCRWAKSREPCPAGPGPGAPPPSSKRGEEEP